MPLMPGNVAKGRILEKFEAELADITKRQAILADLETNLTTPIETLAANHGIVNAGEKAHLKNDWFERSGRRSWWPEFQPVDDVVRAGLVLAIRLSLRVV